MVKDAKHHTGIASEEVYAKRNHVERYRATRSGIGCWNLGVVEDLRSKRPCSFLTASVVTTASTTGTVLSLSINVTQRHGKDKIWSLHCIVVRD